MEDVGNNPVSEAAGMPLHRETVVDETAQLTVDTADVEDGSKPSVLYIRSSESFCTVVAVDGDDVTAAVVAVDADRRSLSGEHTGQSGRTQFFQCQMICRRRAQCCTAVYRNKHRLLFTQFQQTGEILQLQDKKTLQVYQCKASCSYSTIPSISDDKYALRNNSNNYEVVDFKNITLAHYF